MSEFKTRAEIAAANEFIQYLEKLRSSSPLGTNRALERLAENTNALMQRVQQLNFGQVLGGGTWSLSSGTLSFSSNITIMLFGETGQAAQNAISSAASPINFPGFGAVAYVVVDRATGGLIGSVQVALSGNYITAISGQDDRLDYIIIAWYDFAGVTFPDGRRLLDGESLSNNGFTDTQYGQQTELTQVRENQKENLNLRLVGGGDLTWDEGTTTLTWSQNLLITFPQSAGSNRVIAGSVSIPANNAWYATLSRSPAGIIDVATGVASIAGGVPDTDDTFVLAVHNGADDRIYLADGTALSDAETVKLGGVRIGVQWYYKSLGAGVQVTDFAASLGASTSYRRGTGELMVYRNGIKAIASRAFWEGGTYPGTGALNTTSGGISAFDDYVEEDAGDGTGTRIIWLEDDSGDTIEHAAGTHDPPLEYPAADDLVEAFIGVQGQRPTVSVPDGIYGFEQVWTPDLNTIRLNGGHLVSQGEQYTYNGVGAGSGADVTVADMIGSEVLSPGDWHYIYIGPNGPGTFPDFKLSVKSPDVTLTGPGIHPDFNEYRFISSVRVRATSDFIPFVKSGSDVTLGRYLDVASAFAAAVTGAWEVVDLSTALPAGVNHVKFRLAVTSQAAYPAGDRLLLEFRSNGFPAPGQELYSVKPGNSNELEYVVDLVLDSSQQFEIRMDPANIQNVGEAKIIAYSEGRHSSGQGLL